MTPFDVIINWEDQDVHVEGFYYWKPARHRGNPDDWSPAESEIDIVKVDPVEFAEDQGKEIFIDRVWNAIFEQEQ